MKSLILASSLVILGFANDHYLEVSRAGKNILKAVEISTAGASTPKVLFGKTTNPADEPKYKDHLTPTGSRQ
jgi:hypothetical protein